MSFAYTDMLDGVSVVLIYLALPVFVLFVVNAILGIWNGPLNIAFLQKCPRQGNAFRLRLGSVCLIHSPREI